MSLYDVIPESLFSILASKNKGLYSKSLFVLLDAFKRQLKIPKSQLVSMILATLEDDIFRADFSDEELQENEGSYSGKAHFLVRRLKSSGWIMVETEDDFEEYVTLPNFSIKIIQLLSELTHATNVENFAYVYSTYSSLKVADGTHDKDAEPFEMVTALYDGASRTEQLVESLKSAYHSITYYNQQQINMINVNAVLDSHFTLFREEVVAKILRPLKIKDSVPKYKMPLTLILRKWLVYDDILDSMAEYVLTSKKFGTIEECKIDIQTKIHYIIDTYDSLEREYINVIDKKNRQYTRATTQKIDYLINSDQSVRGNLISILKAMSKSDNDSIWQEQLSDIFELYQQSYVGEESLYERKQAKIRQKSDPVEVNGSDIELIVKAKALAAQMMSSKYSKKNVRAFVNKLLENKEEASTKEITIWNDDTYIMTLLSIVQASEESSTYKIIHIDENVFADKYTVPFIIYRKKEA